MMPLGFSLGFACASALGRSTWAADSMVTEVVTMKMINKTRKMSVNGVMLMSEKTLASPPWRCFGPLTAIGLPPLQGGIDQASGIDPHHRVDVLNLDVEVVVENN